VQTLNGSAATCARIHLLRCPYTPPYTPHKGTCVLIHLRIHLIRRQRHLVSSYTSTCVFVHLHVSVFTLYTSAATFVRIHLLRCPYTPSYTPQKGLVSLYTSLGVRIHLLIHLRRVSLHSGHLCAYPPPRKAPRCAAFRSSTPGKIASLLALILVQKYRY